MKIGVLRIDNCEITLDEGGWIKQNHISDILPKILEICAVGFLSHLVPAVIKSHRNHKEVYISYKLIGPVS